jgi:hypothetical protein
MYSISDLHSVKKGELVQLLESAHAERESHIRECPLCQAKGFICEICNDSAVIFPFDSHTTSCFECKTVFHSDCREKAPSCPKCIRREKYRERASSAAKAPLDGSTSLTDDPAV